MNEWNVPTATLSVNTAHAAEYSVRTCYLLTQSGLRGIGHMRYRPTRDPAVAEGPRDTLCALKIFVILGYDTDHDSV